MSAIETQSKLKLISNALVLLGENPAQSLTDDRYGVKVGVNLFEMLYENEIQTNSWRFATKKASLTQLVDVPVNQYRRAFQIPVDCLIPSHVWPRADYEIYGDRIYTDQSAVDLDYRYKPDVNRCPAYFALYFTYVLAHNMVNPVTEGSAAKIEQFGGFRNRQRDAALYADAQGRPSKPVQDSPFIDVRGRF